MYNQLPVIPPPDIIAHKSEPRSQKYIREFEQVTHIKVNEVSKPAYQVPKTIRDFE